MPAPSLSDKRLSRRRDIERSGALTEQEKFLLKGIHEHGDDMVDTMQNGFDRLDRRFVQVLGSGGLAAFVLVLVVLLMFGQSRGVDVAETASAVKDIVPVVAAPPGSEE
jgi:hypothetical protein